MGLYAQKILPYVLDWVMAGPEMAQYRKEILAGVSGEVLEIGFGTGLNLAYYPNSVKRITTVDVNPGMNSLALKRIRASAIAVDNRVLNSEHLPMADNSFDSVVSTWTLCSIANVEQALKEIYRVLKPDGQFFFVEHGLSDDPKIQVWQNRLTPIQKVITDGCHLNRNIRQLIENQFDAVRIEQFYADNFPKVVGYLYKGVATKN
ncbi:MAG: class I SAM-dependent methyltransferase [Leptolyngbyaceae cyanobacterium HOT.MB2.61]|jgi:ubiquinone/menaquinone biosynthesis C-methylase UbiE|nr:class I SAM-dependent methyltransferase [Leptolyngbyaceae cyanobacterium HOT.MB2.61]